MAYNMNPFANRSPLNSFDGETKFDLAFCKGLHKKGEPKTVSPLKIGVNEFDLELDMAPHGGGSMQLALSFDKGESFRVRVHYTTLIQFTYHECRCSSPGSVATPETVARTRS